MRWCLVLFLLLQFGGAPARAADAEITPEERYELGLRYMKRNNYTKAMEQFNRIRNYHRDHPVSLKAELAIAELHFKQGEFEQARYAYDDFARLHPRNDDMDLVIYKTGLSIYKGAPKHPQRDQTQTRSAVSTWTGFAQRFPESAHLSEVEELLQKCTDRLADKELAIATFYAKREAHGAARGRAEGMVKRFPTSDRVPAALALAATSAHAWGDVDAASAHRARLAADFPEAKQLAAVDKALAKPPGTRPEERIFTRPYRVSGSAVPGGAPGM